MTSPSETATNHQLAAWRGEDAGTEELRTAVRHYRAFGNRLADFSRETWLRRLRDREGSSCWTRIVSEPGLNE
jgi:hypothetical protein